MAEEKVIDGEVYEVIDDSPKEVEAPEPTLREQLALAFKGEDQDSDNKEEEDLSPGEEAQVNGIVPSDENPITTEHTDELPPISPPESWKPEDRELFSKVPRDIQEVLSRREQERDRGVRDKLSELNKKERRHQEIEDVLEGYSQRWALEGKSPSVVLQGLVAMEEALNRDPVNTLTYLARQKGIDLKTLGQTVTQQHTQSPEIQTLLQRQQQLENYLAQQQEEAKQQTLQNAMVGVERFSKEVDQAGKLKRPYFEKVATSIQRILPGIMQERPEGSQTEWLEEAYNTAIYLNSEVRAQVLADEQKAKEKERLRNQEEKISKAKKASVSVKSSGAGSEENGQADDSIRSLLRAGFDGRL